MICIIESKSATRYNICIVVDRNVPLWEKFTSMKHRDTECLASSLLCTTKRLRAVDTDILSFEELQFYVNYVSMLRCQEYLGNHTAFMGQNSKCDARAPY